MFKTVPYPIRYITKPVPVTMDYVTEDCLKYHNKIVKFKYFDQEHIGRAVVIRHFYGRDYASIKIRNPYDRFEWVNINLDSLEILNE